MSRHFINLSFILLVVILDGLFCSVSQMKACNFLNPPKIAIQHLIYIFFSRQIGPNTGDISLNHTKIVLPIWL